MSADRVRLAGSGRRADGATVTWTIADGRRGRRWREVVVLDGDVVLSLLYETGPDRRFTHLELASAAGLATLHPEPDGTLHGNVVRTDGGVEHVRGLAAPGGAVQVEGSVVTTAALAWAGGGNRQDVGAGVEAVVLDPASLTIARGTVALDVTAADADGIPALAARARWRLEDDPGA